MNFKSMTISYRLKATFIILMLMIMIISIIAAWQSNELHQQTKLLYDHPLQMRRAIERLNVDIGEMSIHARDMILADDSDAQIVFQEKIIEKDSRISATIDLMEDIYLGPAEDVYAVRSAYKLWNYALTRNIESLFQGNRIVAIKNIQSKGEVDTYKQRLINEMAIIDKYALEKADTLYVNSNELNNRLKLVTIMVLALFLTIVFALYRNIYGEIKEPLANLIQVSKDIQKNKLSTRSTIVGNTEFGNLAASFNKMLESIELNSIINEKSANLTGIMLTEVDAKSFFETLLSNLILHTNGQFGGVYLLSENHETFDLFLSIGLNNDVCKSFDRESLEGELGLVVSTKKIQYLKQISDMSTFSFKTSTVHLVPKEIISIPIEIQEDVIAIITLGSVVGFESLTIELIEDILTAMSARIQGVLTYREIVKIKEQLQLKNVELENQKIELSNLSTELAIQNSELECQKEELSEVSRIKSNFLSNMSHELRTPLNSVIALSGVLERRLKGQISEEDHSFLNIIGRSGKNLLNMINDILDISKIESGRFDVENEAFDFNALINDITEMMNPIASEKGITIVTDTLGEEMNIFSDEKLLRHIIQNLVSNAVKFTEEGQVDIVTQILNHNLVLKVSDTGIGISEQNKKHIFEEFRQADGSTTRKYGGTGLGLAITKKYIELLKGKIVLDSKLGKGSTFTVTIPLVTMYDSNPKESQETFEVKEDSDKTEIHQKDDVSKGENERSRLLIVEDSEPALIQIQDVFSTENYHISIARNGADALRLIEESLPDAIVLDLMMPEIDGYQVMEMMNSRADTANIPILILTAKYIDQEELNKLKYYKIHQIVQKGNIDIEILKSAVSSMLSMRKISKVEASEVHKSISVQPTVLVVEDNPYNMVTVRAILGDHFRIIEAIDGETAVSLAEEHIPDLILMDIALPGMDGVEAFKTIRRNRKLVHVPIIALTASAMTTDREIYLAYGFDAFIAKPIIEKQFLETIYEVLYGE